MQPRLVTLITLIFIMTISFQCKKSDQAIVTSPTIDTSFPNVDQALWPYFQRFEEEASTRGVVADLVAQAISGIFADIPTANVIGQCNYNSNAPEQVTIDTPFWRTASDLGKEFVVFHELGHCFLHRSHLEDTDANGYCKSLMRSGTGTCRDHYTINTRKAYLDELFSIKQ